MINFEKIKNIHWLIAFIISSIVFLVNLFKRKLNKSEKELLQKIRSRDNQKVVFIKFDNTKPFSRDIDIEHNDKNLISLIQKGYLQVQEKNKSISYTLVN